MISHKYLNHGKDVPTRKCSKFNYSPLIHKVFTTTRYYSTSPKENDDNIPAKFYDDAYSMKKTILEENKGKSGIFMLTNQLTGDIYVGQSKDLLCSKRLQKYSVSAIVIITAKRTYCSQSEGNSFPTNTPRSRVLAQNLGINPIFYEDSCNLRQQILIENKGKSGIYPPGTNKIRAGNQR